MFPITNKEIEAAEKAAVKKKEVKDIGRSMKFDFEKRQFVFTNGQAEEITQTEAVKQWLETMCRTLPNKYPVYFDSGFGIETDKLIGYKALPKGFIYSEINRQIKENAEIVGCINSITNFSAENTNGVLTISFTAVLNNGEGVDVIV